LFIGFTTPHGVVASGPMLVAFIGIAAVAVVVAAVNVISMGPTIVRIVEPFPAGSGHLAVVVLIVVVVLVVVWIGVGVVVGIVIVIVVAAGIVVGRLLLLLPWLDTGQPGIVGLNYFGIFYCILLD
jgi:hypothetical protein